MDTAGNAYVAGTTDATNFPTAGGALQGTLPGVATNTAFVTKLNPTGTALVLLHLPGR